MKLQCYIDDVYQKYFMAEKSKLQPHDVDIEEYLNKKEEITETECEIIDMNKEGKIKGHFFPS